jgi:hypothetical protein
MDSSATNDTLHLRVSGPTRSSSEAMGSSPAGASRLHLMHGAYRMWSTYGLKRGLCAWRADGRVVGLESLHDERDRKDDAK